MSEDLPAIYKEELTGHLDNDQIVIIDVRDNWSASDRKIKGAQREDPNQVDSWQEKYDRTTKIVLYCSTPHEKTSRDVAKQMLAAGFKDIRVLVGGWVVWQAAGLPTQRKLKEPLPEGFIKNVIKD
jgi:rhodanese-related sulfurtransferase